MLNLPYKLEPNKRENSKIKDVSHAKSPIQIWQYSEILIFFQI